MQNKNIILVIMIIIIAVLLGYFIGNIRESTIPIVNQHVNQNVNVNTESTKDKVNINTATKKELESLYNIGEIKAQKIIDNRPYISIYDLVNIIGEKTFENLKDRLGV
ncbi:MAG: comEA [Anaerocolumna sp.]|jgi:competence protein ComEA|nr:comEA [Anaerocolumna sp.]